MSDPPEGEWLRSAPFARAGVAMFDHHLGERSAESTLVTATMRSGRQFFSFGIQFTVLEKHAGCVLLLDRASDPERGVVVRDADILDIQIDWQSPQTSESEPTQFGFNQPRRHSTG